MKNLTVVCEYGWIVKGQLDEELSNDSKMVMHEASVVRRWTNGKGIGGIAKAENKHEYTLDAIGDVEIYQNKILFTIPCEW
jgi:hypothetical protein